jgi:8-oxo-dGTP pyrophosphatase MutT (NUDIX family)
VSSWQPSQDLVADLRRALAHAPRQTRGDRFEAWAWRALLDEDGPAILTRDAAPAHVTASAIVLSPDLRRTCLVLHRRLRAWVQPGGHLEPGDDCLAAAAAREALEETGLGGVLLDHPVVLSRHPAPCRPEQVDWHLDVEFALITDEVTVSLSEESLDVAWFDVDALPEELADDTRRCLDRAVEAAEAARGHQAPSGAHSRGSWSPADAAL